MPTVAESRWLDEIGQRDPLLERQLLRSRRHRDSDLTRGARPIRDLLLEQLSELFSSLRKSAAYERNQQLRVVIGQFVRRTRSQTDERGIDIRLRQKDVRWNRAQVFHAALSLNDQGKNSIILGARGRRKTRRDFLL